MYVCIRNRYVYVQGTVRGQKVLFLFLLVCVCVCMFSGTALPAGRIATRERESERESKVKEKKKRKAGLFYRIFTASRVSKVYAKHALDHLNPASHGGRSFFFVSHAITISGIRTKTGEQREIERKSERGKAEFRHATIHVRQSNHLVRSENT